MAEDINKYNIPTDTELKPSPSRMRLSTMSLPSLKITSGVIYEESRKELQYPNNLKVYQQMVLEPTIASAISLLEILISRSQWKVKAPESSSQEEKDRAAFINWSINNMDRPWEEYIIEFFNYIQWGFQPVEKVYKKLSKGDYKGRIGLKDFRSISPSTITKWIYEIESGELAGLRQEISRITSDFNRNTTKKTWNDIPRKKFMLFRYNTKLDNPQGVSPLRACYIPYKQKATLEDYLLIGASRDLGGVVEVGVDIDFLSRASDPSSDEAQVLAEMDRQAAMLHAGEQAFIRKPIAYDDRGNPLFTFDLVGIKGSGKQFNLEDTIKRLENKILMCFLADVLKLGTESQGSYALADSKTTLLSMGVEHHLRTIKRVLDHDLLRQIYILNGWEYVHGESAYFTYGDIESRDLEAVSKFVQRTITSGALRPTKEIENFLLSTLNIETMEEDDMEFLDTVSTSRASESNGTSGYGNSMQDNSDENMDNAA